MNALYGAPMSPARAQSILELAEKQNGELVGRCFAGENEELHRLRNRSRTCATITDVLRCIARGIETPP